MKHYKDIKTFEDACKVEGLDSNLVIPDFSCYPEKDRMAMEAHAKLVIITRAANRLANDGRLWTPDWSNHEEIKYEIGLQNCMPDMEFSYFFHVVWDSNFNVGSRLCYRTQLLAEFIVNQFKDLFIEYFYIK